MHTHRRLARRACAALLIALALTATPAAADEHPRQPLDPWAGLTYAVRARNAAEAHWYLTVHDQHEQAAQRVRQPRDIGPMVLDGDRFDRLARCESGGDPTNTSPDGQYLGAFQFLASSYRAAGGAGDPRADSYATQKGVAMRWASMTNPATQWPVCWPRSA